MKYTINEGVFDIPEAANDRSVNMLVLNLGPNGLTLVVSRDVLPAQEDLMVVLRRQLRVLASQVKSFTQRNIEEVEVGACRLRGLQVSCNFKQNGATVHQLQTMVLLDATGILTFTLTSASVLTEEQRAYAGQMLSTFVPFGKDQ